MNKTIEHNTAQLQQNEDQLKEIMSRVYELLDEARKLVPFFKAIVEYKGEKYWAELQLRKNPFNYPDVNEYYWQSKFGLPNSQGFWYDLYELDRTGTKPHVGRNKDGRKIQTTANAFDSLKPALNGSYRIEDFKVIKKIC